MKTKKKEQKIKMQGKSLEKIEPRTPSEIETSNLDQRGLYDRYEVKKADGTKSPEAVYFVLRLDKKGDDPTWAEVCRAAVRRLCKRLKRKKHLLTLATELKQLVKRIEDE